MTSSGPPALADEHIDTLLPDAMAAAEQALAAAEHELRETGYVLPGVVDLLERLRDAAGVRQTLLTGNLTANAAVKVGAFGLTELFDAEVGAYGTDHADRLELVPIALERVARFRDERYDPDEVWVVGDTPNDLACARAGGCAACSSVTSTATRRPVGPPTPPSPTWPTSTRPSGSSPPEPTQQSVDRPERHDEVDADRRSRRRPPPAARRARPGSRSRTPRPRAGSCVAPRSSSALTCRSEYSRSRSAYPSRRNPNTRMPSRVSPYMVA